MIIPRSVSTKGIIRIKKLPALGWRYSVSAKGQKRCLCPACISGGEYGDGKLLNAKLTELEKKMSKNLPASEQASVLSSISDLIGAHKVKLKSWETMVEKADLTNNDVFIALGYFLLDIGTEPSFDKLIQILKIAPDEVKADLVFSILCSKGKQGLTLLGNMVEIAEVKKKVDEYFDNFI